MVAGGVHGCWGACVVAGVCVVAGCWGHAWLPGGHAGLQGECALLGGHAWLPGGVHGCGGHVWLLGACVVAGGMCGCRGACMGYDEIRSMSGRYASYWNAFLFIVYWLH